MASRVELAGMAPSSQGYKCLVGCVWKPVTARSIAIRHVNSAGHLSALSRSKRKIPVPTAVNISAFGSRASNEPKGAIKSSQTRYAPPKAPNLVSVHDGMHSEDFLDLTDQTVEYLEQRHATDDPFGHSIATSLVSQPVSPVSGNLQTSFHDLCSEFSATAATQNNGGPPQDQDSSPSHTSDFSPQLIEEWEQFLQQFDKQNAKDNFEPFDSKSLMATLMLRTLPRHHISDELMKILLVWAKIVGDNVPTFSSIKKNESKLESCYTDKTIQQYHKVTTPDGNIFFCNAIEQMVINDMTNPRIRPNLELYPRFGETCKNYCDGSLLQSIENVYQPMVILEDGSHVYVGELVMLSSGKLAFIQLWYTNGKEMRARALEVRRLNQVGMSYDVQDNMSLDFPISQIEFANHFLSLRMGTHEYSLYRNNKRLANQHPLRKLANGLPIFRVPYKPFSDDVSGNRTTKWNVHYSFYMKNAALPSELRNSDSNLHFICTSNTATPMEMADYLVKCLEHFADNPIKSYDCFLDRNVLIVPFPLVKLADNPMAAEDCASMGSQARFNCRKCKCGGTDEYKRTANGFASLLKPGEPRTPADTRAKLDDQLKLAVTSSKSAFNTSKTENGVRDKKTDEVAEILFQYRDTLTAKGFPALRVKELANGLLDILKLEPYYSPWIRTDIIDIHRQTPIEILHTFKLGPVKYAWRTLMNMHKEVPGFTVALQTCLESLSCDTLSSGAQINASYFIRFAGGLVGREFGIIVQALPCVLPMLLRLGLIKEETKALWLSLGRLGSYLFQQEIPSAEMDQYCEGLRISLNQLYAQMAWYRPSQIVESTKWHLLSHAEECVRAIGPLHLAATEDFEKHNGVFRYNSIFSNRLAPSRDIAASYRKVAAMRHILSGGFYPSAAGQMTTAHSNVLALAKDMPHFMQRYDLGSSKAKIPGTVADTADTRNKLPSQNWLEETRCQYQNPTLGRNYKLSDFTCAASVISQSAETCSIGSFVHLGRPFCHDTAISTCVARIEAVLTNSQYLQYRYPFNTPTTVIVRVYERDTVINTDWEMPTYNRTDILRAISAEVVSCLMHFVHDCISLDCAFSRAATPIIQERHETTIQKAGILHQHADARFVWNICQSRSASELRHLNPPLPPEISLARIGARAQSVFQLQAAVKKRKKAQKSTMNSSEDDDGDLLDDTAPDNPYWQSNLQVMVEGTSQNKTGRMHLTGRSFSLLQQALGRSQEHAEILPGRQRYRVYSPNHDEPNAHNENEGAEDESMDAD